MKKTFDLTHNSKILIYGCGDIGRNMAQKLTLKKYNVAAFIDRNANQIRIWNHIPVIDLEQMADMDKIAEYIVFITLHNGMSHESVAFECYQHGINNIVYLPMHVSRSYEDRYAMRRIYKYLYSYQFELVKNVPVYELLDEYKKDLKIIDIYASGEIAFWCPVKKLNVTTADSFKKIPEEYQKYAYPEFLKYQECRIQDFTPYIDFFQWLKGSDIAIDSYLRYTGRYSEKLRMNWLHERKELYEIYLDALKHDLTFFTDAPSPCVWNTKGFFTFEEGLTRGCFLISEGYDEIPICVSKEDYHAWKNYEESIQ